MEQRQVPIAPGVLMGTDHVYVVPGAEKERAGKIGDKKRCVILLYPLWCTCALLSA